VGVFGQHWESADLRLLVFWSTILFPLVRSADLGTNLNIYRGAARGAVSVADALQTDFSAAASTATGRACATSKSW